TDSNRSPVWRLAAVRGDEAFGTDPTGFVTSNTDKTILDPSRSGGPAVERAFYFAEPTPQLKASPAGDLSENDANNPPPSDGVFWLSSAPSSPLSSQTVVGSARSFDCSDTDGAPDGAVLTFEDENNLQGSLTIPTTKHASEAPYKVLAEGVLGAPWTGPVDRPLDSFVQTDFDAANDITSKALLDANDDPILMQNGTHENFAVIHLQRLANPTNPWHPATNPYITVDSMPVDLTVVNFSSNGAGSCYDEPGYSGANPLTYLNQQKDFGRDNVLKAESVERGGKDEMDDSQEDNLWNSRVNPAITNLRDGEAMRSKEDIGAARAPATSQPVDPAFDPIVLTPTIPLQPTHTFADSPARSPDPAASPSEGPELPWFFFPNRPFANSVEVSLVPTSSPFNLLKQYSVDTGLTPRLAHLPGFWEDLTPPAPWDAITGRSNAGGAGNTMSLLDFVHVPNRFAGLATTIPNISGNTTALQELGLDELAYGHVSHVREPGRININTIIDGKDTADEAAGAWRALLGKADYAGDIDVQTTTGLDSAPQFLVDDANGLPEDLNQVPSKGFLDTIQNKVPRNRSTWRDNWAPQNAGDPIEPHRNTDRNPYFRYSTITQLADRVTTRSNVFAVWVTIGFFEENADQSVVEITPVKRLRGFYLFDRSIPVAYQQGRDNNIRDAILLRRIIE
ncbi:MAG: hypothetical protein ABGW78_04890, partial [Pirellulales bacterium]